MIIGFFEFLIVRNFEFNINYDFNLFNLETPNIYRDWLNFNDVTDFLRRMAFTFTILWIAPLGYLIHRWKLDKWLLLYIYGIVAIVIIATLSHSIARVVYFLVVIYLPLFLRFLRDFNLKLNKETLNNFQEILE